VPFPSETVNPSPSRWMFATSAVSTMGKSRRCMSIPYSVKRAMGIGSCRVYPLALHHSTKVLPRSAV